MRNVISEGSKIIIRNPFLNGFFRIWNILQGSEKTTCSVILVLHRYYCEIFCHASLGQQAGGSSYGHSIFSFLTSLFNLVFFASSPCLQELNFVIVSKDSGSDEDFLMEDDDDSDYGSSKKKNKKASKKSKPERKEKKMPKPRLKATGEPM